MCAKMMPMAAMSSPVSTNDPNVSSAIEAGYWAAARSQVTASST